MSFLSAIGTIFKSAATGVAKLGDAVRGVGAAAFTASAATGASASGGGLASLFSGGTLGSMFKGVTSVLAGGPGAVLGAAAGAPAALGAAVGGAASTAAGAAGTATGLIPDVANSAGEGTGFMKFLSSEGGLGLIGGAAEGLGKYMEAKDAAEERQADRDALRDRERRITEGYEVDSSALVGGDAIDSGSQRPTPAQAYARDAWVYNNKSGRVELKRAS